MEIEFYDGIVAKPKAASITFLDRKTLLVQVGAGQPIPIGLSGCRYVEFNDRGYVYLDKTSTRYLSFSLGSEQATCIKKELNARKGRDKPRWQSVFKFTTLFVLAIVVFVSLVVWALPEIGTRLIDKEQEIKMGEEAYQSMIKDIEIDKELTEEAEHFASALALSKNYSIRLTVVNNDSVVNAFALPGGHILIYTGLLKRIRSAEELDALLSHESVHVEKRHVLHGMVSGFSALIILRTIFQDWGLLGHLFVLETNGLIGLRFGRSLEREADESGMRLMLDSGFDPAGMESLMRTLQQSVTDKSPPLILSSHPLTEERIENAKAFCGRYKNRSFAPPAKSLAIWDKMARLLRKKEGKSSIQSLK